MSSIFGLWSSYMLEYCWLFALLLRSARYFPGVEGKWTQLPPMLPPFPESPIFLFLTNASEESILLRCHFSLNWSMNLTPNQNHRRSFLVEIDKIFKVYFIDYAITVFPIFPLYPRSALHALTLQHSLLLHSCPWVVHINSLNSLFPIPFLTSPHLFYAYQLCFFFPVPPPPFLPTEISPCDVHFSDPVPVLFCLVSVFIFFFFRFSCW